MSVAMTTDAVIERRKTVTRRKGWWEDKNGRRLLRPGDTLTLCRKVQGRKPGEPLERLAEVEVASVRREVLGRIVWEPEYGAAEVAAEGFPGLDPFDFYDRYFIAAQGIGITEEITRIEWRYICGSGFCNCGRCVL